MLRFRIEETAPPNGTLLCCTEINSSGASWRRLRNLNFENCCPQSMVPIVVYSKFLVLLLTSSRPALSPFALARKGVEMYPVFRGNRPAAFGKSHPYVSGRHPEAPRVSLQRSGLPERKHQPPDHHRKVPDTQFRPDKFRNKDAFGRTRNFHCSMEKDVVNK